MRLCKRGFSSIYIRNPQGDVVVCAWVKDQLIGNLHEASFYDIYHGKKATELRERLAAGDYSKCMVAHCPYCAQNNVESMLIDVDEIPEYPDTLYLSFENVCNYNCPSCTVNCMMTDNKNRDLEADYAFIEEQIKPILPHLKHIGANGLGELFVSKHIMNLLAEWRPLAPKEEISVSLETNGSLFNEENWKKIENIGQYKLHVSITVMSFDEHIYQVLSGTKLPISNIEKNLMFVKSLRDQGIINSLHLCTVVQERNFRTLPELTRRFIEEYGADEVRLRPYAPWGRYSLEKEWFADVRNPNHPYYEEYLEVMKHPIFKHPKVNDWGGDKPSKLGEHPWKKDLDRALDKLSILEQLMENSDEILEKIKNFLGIKNLIIYGIGPVGKGIIQIAKDKLSIEGIIDKYTDMNSYEGIKISRPEQLIYNEDSSIRIIVCILNNNEVVDNIMKDMLVPRKEYVYIDELVGISLNKSNI